ncbi:MAG: hypothetical protein AB7Q00_13135 [Phycisphaerales bacterium]
MNRRWVGGAKGAWMARIAAGGTLACLLIGGCASSDREAYMNSRSHVIVNRTPTETVNWPDVQPALPLAGPSAIGVGDSRTDLVVP